MKTYRERISDCKIYISNDDIDDEYVKIDDVADILNDIENEINVIISDIENYYTNMGLKKLEQLAKELY